MFKWICSGTRILAVMALATIASISTAFAADSIGKIKTLDGQATIVRGADKIPAALGMDIQLGDRIETKAKSSIGVLFLDDTRLSLAANSSLTIDNYVFKKETDSGSFVTNLLRGTLAYLSGKIGKTSPENVKVKTPLATIGIRGTKFVVTLDS